MVRSIWASTSPPHTLAPPGSMLAVPEISRRSSTGVRRATARLKELP